MDLYKGTFIKEQLIRLGVTGYIAVRITTYTFTFLCGSKTSSFKWSKAHLYCYTKDCAPLRPKTILHCPSREMDLFFLDIKNKLYILSKT